MDQPSLPTSVDWAGRHQPSGTRSRASAYSLEATAFGVTFSFGS